MEARLLRRYKRFLADIRFPDGSIATVHCPNPGAMLGLDRPESRVFVSRSPNTARKYRLGLELVETDEALVGINTALPNRLVAEALENGTIAELAGYAGRRPEVRYGRRSRVDFLLTGKDGRNCYLEVKNVHLSRRPGLAEFPDCVTKRGTRHLQELGDQVEAGHRAVLIFVVQRPDAAAFDLAADIDPAYAAAFHRARARGVEVLACSCTVSTQEIEIARPLPIVVRPLQPASASTK